MDKAKKSVFVGKEATIVSGECSGITGMVVGADSNENTVEIDVEGATIFTAYDNITQETAREIKFRGKRMDDYGWAYGSLTNDYIVGDIVEVTYDYISNLWWARVDPATVGQYTGLKDKNGVEIYEEDIVKWDDRSDGLYWRVAVLYYDQFGRLCYQFISKTTISTAVGAVWYQGQFAYAETTHIDLEVIGNIHDNPELLKVGGKR